MTTHYAPILRRLLDGTTPDRDETRTLVGAIINGELTDVDIAATLIALKMLGEPADTIAGAATALLDASTAFPRPDGNVADIVGTGGDASATKNADTPAGGTINISTAATFVTAAAGVPVAKHGNRSVSSQSGAADVMERLGADLTMTPTTARDCLDHSGMTFLFAPHYHPGVKHVMPVRKHLKTRTLFNILGPLINPARPNIMLVGVYHPDLTTLMADTLATLGCERALVVHGLGLDEIAMHGHTTASRVIDSTTEQLTFTPKDFGADEFPLTDLAGGTPEENTDTLQRILAGEGHEAHASAIAVNTAAILHLAGHADTLPDAYALARNTIDAGHATDTCNKFVAASQGVTKMSAQAANLVDGTKEANQA